MFNFRKKQPPQNKLPVAIQMRDTVWCDAPMDQWPPGAAEGEPWGLFDKARKLVSAGKPAEAIEQYLAIVNTPNWESNHYLQAWHFLRQLKYPVPADYKALVYAVIVEASVPNGYDLMAAYRDNRARFYSWSNAATIWERPDNRLDQPIQKLIEAGQINAQFMPVQGFPRLPIPPKGNMRISMLTPAGVGYVEGNQQYFLSSPYGQALLMSAVGLLNAITEITLNSKSH